MGVRPLDTDCVAVPQALPDPVALGVCPCVALRVPEAVPLEVALCDALGVWLGGPDCDGLGI